MVSYTVLLHPYCVSSLLVRVFRERRILALAGELTMNDEDELACII